MRIKTNFFALIILLIVSTSAWSQAFKFALFTDLHIRPTNPTAALDLQAAVAGQVFDVATREEAAEEEDEAPEEAKRMQILEPHPLSRREGAWFRVEGLLGDGTAPVYAIEELAPLLSGEADDEPVEDRILRHSGL